MNTEDLYMVPGIGEDLKWLKKLNHMEKMIAAELILVTVLAAGVWLKYSPRVLSEMEYLETDSLQVSTKQEGSIKWVDFNVSYEALCAAYDLDVETYDTDHPVKFVEILAYTAAKTGGNFDKAAIAILKKAGKELADADTDMEELTEGLKYYDYYLEAYQAVLGNMVGEYDQEYVDDNGEKRFRRVYGLKAYFPLAQGFDYTHYDDFGVSRSYGYQRKHLGHDMMGQIGTPIISVESGYVEALGWNQYGGWRVGIRSLDGKRYYYYAHLRQNYPYAEGLKSGDLVLAGDVIGYMGHTGYSTKENVNNIAVTHLHWGLELIFDEERRDKGNEIWIDVYPLTKFLAKHSQQVYKIEGTREWSRTLTIVDPHIKETLEEEDQINP